MRPKSQGQSTQAKIEHSFEVKAEAKANFSRPRPEIKI